MRPPTHLMRMPATITRRTQTGTVDEYGSPAWETTTTPAVCALFPVTTSESGERPAAEFTHRAYFPPGTPIGSNDRVTAGAREWEVVGEPAVWTHPGTLDTIYISVDLTGWTDTQGGGS